MGFFDLFSPRRRELRRRIEPLLRQGILAVDEIVGELVVASDEELDRAGVKQLVQACWADLARSELARPTPVERLQAAFDALEAAGVMARHYPMSGRAEAEALVRAELAAAARSGRTYTGYCFWDRHLLGMLSDGALAFCFGPAVTPATYAGLWSEQVKVATKIAAALRRQGFHVEWSGRAADVVQVTGVDWSGPRDAGGAPRIRTGRIFQEHAPALRAESPAPVNVYVSCPPGSPTAHRLIEAIARHAAVESYGSPDHFAEEPAAVAVRTGAGTLLDLVAGEADPGPRAIMRRRDLAGECALLVAVANDPGRIDRSRWDEFLKERRVLVVLEPNAPSQHGGSPVQPVAVATGEGIAELLALLDTAGSGLKRG